jgi:hypothetical protein
MTDTPMTCEQFREISSELALKTLGGESRGTALAHLEQCPACRHELRQLTEVADNLADLAPPAEPPAGFESRVIAGFNATAGREGGAPPVAATREGTAPAARTLRSPKRRPRRRLFFQLVTAAAVAVIIGASGWAFGSSGHSTPSNKHLVSAQLLADSHPVGRVIIDTGTDPWMSMAVTDHGGDLIVRCQLRNRDGTLNTVGTFLVMNGYGFWASPVPHGASITGARLLDAQGHVFASARFHATTPEASS